VRSEEIGSGLWPVASGYLSASAVDISSALARFRSRKSANVVPAFLPRGPSESVLCPDCSLARFS
jgi:hypothetical protein